MGAYSPGSPRHGLVGSAPRQTCVDSTAVKIAVMELAQLCHQRIAGIDPGWLGGGLPRYRANHIVFVAFIPPVLQDGDESNVTYRPLILASSTGTNLSV